jgi:aminomethyltransferase
VRRDAGLFDVSHMRVVDVRGPAARAFLRRALANDVERLAAPGKALYSCMLRDHGGVIDDLIVYFMDDEWFRMVVNAGTRDKDLEWIRAQAGSFEVSVEPRFDLAMIAVQGPNARQKAAGVLDPEVAARALELGVFFGLAVDQWFVARTGYTGEDGFEIMMPTHDAPKFWQRFRDAGITQCGLGARDTLRLEAGLCLYGHDIDATTNPVDAGLGWAIPKVRRPGGARAGGYPGAAAIERHLAGGGLARRVGLVGLERVPVREGSLLVDAHGHRLGQVTSGTFSPSIELPIAMAYLPLDHAQPQHEVYADVRGRKVPMRVTPLPFVPHRYFRG